MRLYLFFRRTLNYLLKNSIEFLNFDRLLYVTESKIQPNVYDYTLRGGEAYLDSIHTISIQASQTAAVLPASKPSNCAAIYYFTPMETSYSHSDKQSARKFGKH